MANNNEFSIGLCEVGNCESCLFSYCCSCCAMAQARTHVDDSPAIFNLFCINNVVGRWLIRDAYQISGDACTDCYTAMFCPCCVANQAYQTAKERGNPVDNGGRYANVNNFETRLPPPEATPQNYLYSCCCMPCAVGDMMEISMGMPWYLGCCCTNVWASRNFLRYEYRIQGNDVLEEVIAPCGAHCVTNVVQHIIPCAGCFLWAAYAILVTQLGMEARAHPRNMGSYLRGSSAPSLTQSNISDNVTIAPVHMMDGPTAPPTQHSIQMGSGPFRSPPTAIQVYTHNQPIIGHAIPNPTTGNGYRPVSVGEPMKND